MSIDKQEKVMDKYLQSSQHTTQAQHLRPTTKQKEITSPQIIIDKGQQENYNNQFMNIRLENHQQIQRITQQKAPFKKHYKIQRETKNRSKTQPKQTIKINPLQNKKKILFPQLSTNIVELQNKKEKVSKLRELYQKKSKLFKRLQQINKELISVKVQKQIYEPLSHEKASFLNNAQISQQNNGIRQALKPYTKSSSSSKNGQYLHYSRYLINSKKRQHSPQSMVSPQKNREVLSFIKKMHSESIKRDLNRFQFSKQIMQNQIKNVCLECSRQKCQEDALHRILKQSRVE